MKKRAELHRFTCGLEQWSKNLKRTNDKCFQIIRKDHARCYKLPSYQGTKYRSYKKWLKSSPKYKPWKPGGKFRRNVTRYSKRK